MEPQQTPMFPKSIWFCIIVALVTVFLGIFVKKYQIFFWSVSGISTMILVGYAFYESLLEFFVAVHTSYKSFRRKLQKEENH
jgi:cell shape-determining protein MreC